MTIRSDLQRRRRAAVKPYQYRLKSPLLSTVALCVAFAAFHWSVWIGGLVVILFAIAGQQVKLD